MPLPAGTMWGCLRPGDQLHVTLTKHRRSQGHMLQGHHSHSEIFPGFLSLKSLARVPSPLQGGPEPARWRAPVRPPGNLSQAELISRPEESVPGCRSCIRSPAPRRNAQLDAAASVSEADGMMRPAGLRAGSPLPRPDC